jgi:hypothetical protein
LQEISPKREVLILIKSSVLSKDNILDSEL